MPPQKIIGAPERNCWAGFGVLLGMWGTGRGLSDASGDRGFIKQRENQ